LEGNPEPKGDNGSNYQGQVFLFVQRGFPNTKFGMLKTKTKKKKKPLQKSILWKGGKWQSQ